MINLIPFLKAILHLLKVHVDGRAAIGAPDTEAEKILMEAQHSLNQSEQDRLTRLTGQRPPQGP